jgi:hypothetical protein
MLLLALPAGCAGAAVEYSGRCVAAAAPPPRCAMPGNAPDQLRSGDGEAAVTL